MMAKPMKTPELHYPMIQFLIHVMYHNYTLFPCFVTIVLVHVHVQ